MWFGGCSTSIASLSSIIPRFAPSVLGCGFLGLIHRFSVILDLSRDVDPGGATPLKSPCLRSRIYMPLSLKTALAYSTVSHYTYLPRQLRYINAKEWF